MPEFEFDVFLSHNSKDKVVVRELAFKLRDAGVRVWFDEWEIPLGAEIYEAIEKGLERSRTLVLCMSKSAFGSDWVTLERNTRLFRDPVNRQRRFVPILIEDCDIPDTLRRFKYLDFRLPTDELLASLATAVGPNADQPEPDLARNSPPARDTRQAKVLGHTYSLMEIQNLVGREHELKLLDDWVVGSDATHETAMFVLNAIGGMGKSAILWHWLRHRAPTMKGRIWWSFYDVASFDQFVAHALHYITGTPMNQLVKLFPDRRDDAYSQLVSALEDGPYLISLDGLERILVAYSMLDAPYQTGQELAMSTSMRSSVSSKGLPTESRDNHLRRCIEPMAGAFLRRLATLSTSKIVVSTRLFPTDLQTATGTCRPGVYEHLLSGLSDDDAINLWNAYGLNGSRDELLDLFQTFDNHPLLIKVLAAEIAQNRRHRGDFAAWRESHPEFNPFGLPVRQVKTHILQFALSGLNDNENETLTTLSGFRMPKDYETLSALLVRDDGPFGTDAELDAVLDALENRGLLGWDRESNRYDMHPVVRGIVWNVQEGVAKERTCEQLIAFFDAAEEGREKLEKVTSLDELSVPIEKINLLLRLRRYEDAGDFWFSRLKTPLQDQLGFARQHAAILEQFFPEGVEGPCEYRFARWALSAVYMDLAQPGRALPLKRLRATECPCDGCQAAVASPCLHLGKLSEAENIYAKHINGRGRYYVSSMANLLNLWLDRGVSLKDCSDLAAECQTRIVSEPWANYDPLAQSNGRFDRWCNWMRAATRIALKREEIETAMKVATNYREGAVMQRSIDNQISAALLQADILRDTRDFDGATAECNWALAEARRTENEWQELDALVRRAELDVDRSDFDTGEELLNDAWTRLAEGPLPRLHSRASLVKARIELEREHRSAAAVVATSAVKLAWCEGPPYSFHDELEAATHFCKNIAAPIPQLPKYEGSHELPCINLKNDDEAGSTG